MVSVGSKALSSRRAGTFILAEDRLMGEDDTTHKHGRKRGMGRKPQKENLGFDGNGSNKKVSGKRADGATEVARKFSKQRNTSAPHASYIRKQVDPETVKYFSEIANLFESNGVDFEERSIICGNAIEETKGKEFELATDYIISHTLESLLEGCDVDHLCSFLQSSAKDFPFIATDRSGSHVVETAIKSLYMHLQDQDVYSLAEETLTKICKVIVANSADVMCNCYGSHVLRTLMCLLKGVPLDSSEFHVTKSSTVLAERLNIKASKSDVENSSHLQQPFPGLLKFLVFGMLNGTRGDIKNLQVDQFSSLVLQTSLKLLVGHDEELLRMIPILLGCDKEDIMEGNFIKMIAVRDVRNLMKETASSHLMEVVLEVAPERLYNEIFTKVFRNSLFELSSDHCGNFVVQALISHARDKDQMELIWEELGSKFKELFEMGRSGVVASIIAACQRLNTHEQKCSQALAGAVCSVNESPRCIVPRILFLDSYFFCEDRSKWDWPTGVKIQIMGSLILQEVFRYQSEFIQPYVTSITLLEADQVLEAAKDIRGARVIESFLTSDASAKLKRRLVARLRGHFGELSMHASGSFTVEKCFTASNLSLREAIVSELVGVRSELSKSKQGPHLLRRLDVDVFATRPDQWRSKQETKQSNYNEYYATFGSGKSKSLETDNFLTDNSNQASQPNEFKNMRKEIEHSMASATPFLSVSGFKRKPEKAKDGGGKYPRISASNDISKEKSEKLKRKN